MLLSEQDQMEQWNQIVKDELSGAYLGVQDSATSAKIQKMIKDDKKAINENTQKFHKLIDDYVISKRQLIILENAIKELTAKKHEQEQVYSKLGAYAREEEKAIDAVSGSGGSVTGSHNELENKLRDQVASEKAQINELQQLIGKAIANRDKWEKKTHALQAELHALTKLDTV